jgi:flagellar FliJ protein
MKSRETLIRLKKFQVDERRRKVAQIEAMIAEFERISGDLDRDIKTEQDRTGIHDPNHFAYPTYAKAAMQRRENLKRSVDDLKVQLEDAKAALGEAFEEMKKAEMLDERDQMRERLEEVPVPAELAAVGSMGNRARAEGAQSKRSDHGIAASAAVRLASRTVEFQTIARGVSGPLLAILASTTGRIGGHNRRLGFPSGSQARRRLLLIEFSRN